MQCHCLWAKRAKRAVICWCREVDLIRSRMTLSAARGTGCMTGLTVWQLPQTGAAKAKKSGSCQVEQRISTHILSQHCYNCHLALTSRHTCHDKDKKPWMSAPLCHVFTVFLRLSKAVNMKHFSFNSEQSLVHFRSFHGLVAIKNKLLKHHVSRFLKRSFAALRHPQTSWHASVLSCPQLHTTHHH